MVCLRAKHSDEHFAVEHLVSPRAAHYLKGDFKAALKAYREAEKVSKNPDMLVATTNWLYMTLRRLGRTKEAASVVGAIKPDLDGIENADYYKLIRLYQGRMTAAELLKEIS